MRYKASRKLIYNKVMKSDTELSQETLQAALTTAKVTKALLEEREIDISHLKESILQMELEFDSAREEAENLKREFEQKKKQAEISDNIAS